jgi:glycosyltransferase involved in cell wall biosynthesis
MKILYYSPHPHLNLTDKTGYGTHMREMIQAFRDLGHEVLPVINGGTEPRTPSSNQNIKNSSGIKKILKSVVPKFIWRSLKDRRILQFDRNAEIELEKIVNEFKPDLIYERAYYLQVSGVNVASRKKIKHFLEVNAPYVDETFEFEGTNSIYTNQATKAEELQLQLSDRVFVVSSPLKSYFLKKYPSLKADKIQVTPNCVNLDKVKVDGIKKNQIIEKYQLSGHTVVGFVGSIFPYHGVDKMITAFNEVYRNAKTIKLLIVGDGLILNELKSLAQTLEAKHNIIFTGNVPNTEVFSYIDVMDITVLATTEWYCSPIKLFEYGALGKAVVAPDIPAVHDVMINHKDGLLVKPDKEQLAKALGELINNRSERETIGLSFKTKVETNYTWIMNARQVLSSLNSDPK